MKWLRKMKSCKERPEVDRTRGDRFADQLAEVRHLAHTALLIGSDVAREIADYQGGPERDRG